MAEPQNLLLLVIYDPSKHLEEAIRKDRERLKAYADDLVARDYDIGYIELPSTTIASYRDITKLCDKKTRVIIWYTGHGKNLNHTVSRMKDNFPCFRGNNIFIEQYKVLEKLPGRNVLNVVIFDCCNNANGKPSSNVEINILDNFATLFDFEGDMLINSAKRNQSSFCRSSEGSTFTINFLSKFNDSYDNTLRLLTQYFSSSIITYGRLNYEKYVKEDELQTKEQLINERKSKQTGRETLFRLLQDYGDAPQQYNSNINKRKEAIDHDMERICLPEIICPRSNSASGF
eukprot:TRINITY_DN597_c0_g3_i13.p1 TRINITY_DN597_c0_g3~~TRINITY_DN597_c0_g3_i13.p1  ORF type:complete len:288 (+),score=38.58 TRINITY_DN597_c0_g3_i13:34-897(+)